MRWQLRAWGEVRLANETPGKTLKRLVDYDILRDQRKNAVASRLLSSRSLLTTDCIRGYIMPLLRS